MISVLILDINEAKENETKENLHKRLKESFPDSEIDVWDCSLIF